MDIRGLLTEEGAVSPVVGVVVMLAVLVLLAAIVGTFLMDFGDREEPPPQVAFSYDYDFDRNLTITVAGGDSFNSDRVTVDSFNSSLVIFQGTGLGKYVGETWTDADADISGPERVTAGDEVQLDDIQYPGFELTIVWTSSSGERSAIIGSATGPTP
jgi:FlaG/FlaF family flagellin (archaellin)